METIIDEKLKKQSDLFGYVAPPNKLADRFILPPFSVLDARQGAWQERKREWIKLGIQSELGRGNDITWGISPDGVDTHGSGKTYTDAAKKKKNLARCYGQDLMRGEHTVGEKYQADKYNQGLNEKTKKALGCYMAIGGQAIERNAGQTGTSIFDPVLCELMYSWFCPPGGKVLDPFAGGSVRGIVAAYLGLSYTGIDLSERQLQANRHQAEDIFLDDYIDIKISAKSANLKFHGCDPDYINNFCKASCCQSTVNESGTLITIHKSEESKITTLGGYVDGGFLKSDNGRCPFKDNNNLCELHEGNNKPFGCIASPFTLNDNDTLVVRNRYKLLKCYDKNYGIPAYKAFSSSLKLLFGDNWQSIARHLKNGGGDISVKMAKKNWLKLKENDFAKHGKPDRKIPINWITGDAKDTKSLIDERADFIFGCPPYFDLEIYSDDPRDLSNMSWSNFRDSYRQAIEQSVSMLNDNCFACFVVGEIRDKKTGFYRSLVPETIYAFERAGAKYYNEIILITAVGSLPIRAGKQFDSGRKIGKTHQNILVFCKGDSKKATKKILLNQNHG